VPGPAGLGVVGSIDVRLSRLHSLRSAALP
jgi:hypothetical protein